MSAAPILVDGPALLQALRVEVATWQARSLGQRALVDAANAKQMGLIAADATKLQGIYDDVITRLYAVLDRVDTSRPAAAQQGAAQQQPVSTALEPKLQTLYAKATNAALTWPDRYAAVCELILAMTKQTATAQVEQAEAIYDEARRNLGGLNRVATLLRALEISESAAVAWQTEAVGFVDAAAKLRQDYGSGEAYVTALKSASNALRALSPVLRGGQLSRVADAIAELQRLRDDLAVGLQLRHLKR